MIGIVAKQKNLCMKVDDMSQENKIDFITEPKHSFLYDLCPSDFMSECFDHFAVINWIDSELEHTFSGFVVSLITLSYLRINGTSADNKFHIPASASFDSLTYNKGQNFFVDLFNRYRIICELNTVLGGTASILEPSFMSGANDLSVEFQEKIASRILELDWSERGFLNQDGPDMAGHITPFTNYTYPEDWNDKKFTNWACGVYVERELIRENLVEKKTNSAYSELYRQVHHLKLLLNIRLGEKQLCTPILYNTYLVNTFELSGWPQNDCDKLVKNI